MCRSCSTIISSIFSVIGRVRCVFNIRIAETKSSKPSFDNTNWVFCCLAGTGLSSANKVSIPVTSFFCFQTLLVCEKLPKWFLRRYLKNGKLKIVQCSCSYSTQINVFLVRFFRPYRGFPGQHFSKIENRKNNFVSQTVRDNELHSHAKWCISSRTIVGSQRSIVPVVTFEVNTQKKTFCNFF